MDRGKRLVQLALNKELQVKLSNLNRKRTEAKCRNDVNDADYCPETSASSSNSEDEIEAEKDILKQNKKITVISDIIIAPAVTVSLSPNLESVDNESLSQLEILDIVNNIIDHAVDKAEAKLYTKNGTLRKRKMMDDIPAIRKELKNNKYIREHDVKKNCRCKLRCFLRIPYSRQKDTNQQFWRLSKEQQRQFIHSSVEKLPKARSTVKNSETRKYSFKYYLKSSKNEKVQVCKVFFLATLGYSKENDRVLKNVRNTNPKLVIPAADRRRHPSNRKIERDEIKNHIRSFGPSISHYRREHAPNREYLPSDISISKMYKDFQEKFPDTVFSYELYRLEVKNMNISFANLGLEECWTCEKFKIHKKSEMHDENNTDCVDCHAWKIHQKKYRDARSEYKKDSELIPEDTLRVSADLQKVIMLPRLDTFKEIIFTPRIIAFNDTFAPIGKKSKRFPAAMIWHEAVRGRSKDDIISTFYVFFRNNRDITSITIWLDNCSSQNKNWSLVSFFIYIVNSPEVALENLLIKYFEPGHTFMSADAFHHQVELSLKRKKRVYDFNDFASAVKEANSSKVDVHIMELNHFYQFTDCTSKYKLQKLESKILLKDIVTLLFSRNTFTFSYKTDFNAQLTEVTQDIFLAKYKQNIPQPKKCENFKGVSAERKNTLISKLKSHIPENRMLFWEQLSINDDGMDTDE